MAVSICFRRASIQPRVCAMLIKISLEIEELCLQIQRCPEERPVQALATYRADQPFNQRMRQRDIGYCLDFRYVQDAQIGLPLLKPIRRIVIREIGIRRPPCRRT
jgi:hypothetical protein